MRMTVNNVYNIGVLFINHTKYIPMWHIPYLHHVNLIHIDNDTHLQVCYVENIGLYSNI
jgi:hypothetical protein